MTLSAQSKKRADHMVGLIAQLAKRDLTIQQTAEHLAMSSAGAKNYMRDLRGAGLVTVFGHRTGNTGQAPIYSLVENEAAIEAFLADMRLGKPRQPAAPERATLLSQALKDPNRHIHLMRDDTYHPTTLHRFKPSRDALVTALFGAPGVQA